MDSPRPYYKEQFRERVGEEDKGRNGQTIYLSGLGKNYATTQALAHNRHKWSQLEKCASKQSPHDLGGSRDQSKVNDLPLCSWGLSTEIGFFLIL